MVDIFAREEETVAQGELYITQGAFQSQADANKYLLLLEEYKNLLRQFKKIVKMSDMTQLKLKDVSEKLDSLSYIDPLTGLFNRRYFNENYFKEWNSAVRNKKELAVIMVDVDYFKVYNDTFGHLQGDECLKAVAQAIKDSVKRPRDLVARFGGEEFIVMLPETGTEGAALIAGSVINAVRALDLENPGSPWDKKITVSVGVSVTSPREDMAKEDLINRSDQALYQAKSSGKNCYKIN